MVLVIMAGCAAPAVTPADTGSAASGTEASESAPAASELEPVELVFTYRAQPMADLQEVQDALNVLLKEKINATVKLNPIDPGAWNDRIQLAIAGGETMDLVFTANWTNNYYQNVAQENFLPLDDLLAEYAPGLLASMEEQIWNGTRIGGQIYGIPALILWAQPWGVQLRADLVDKYGFDYTTIDYYSDLTPYLEELKANEPDITPIYSDQGGGGRIFRADDYNFEIIGTNTGVAINMDDSDLKVFSMYATDEYREAAELAHSWYEAGYYLQDPLPAADANAAMAAGRFAIGLHLVPEGSDVTLRNRWGHDFYLAPVTDEPHVTTGRVTSNLLAIPANSEHPERAAMLLELLNTDLDVFNLIANGIQGKHWEWVDEANFIIGFPEGVTATTSGYNPNTPYLFGSTFNDPYRSESQIGLYDRFREINASAPASAGLGFAPDFSEYTTELAQISAVVGEFAVPIEMGRVDPSTAIPEFLAKLDQAGLSTLLEESQRQLDAWKASK